MIKDIEGMLLDESTVYSMTELAKLAALDEDLIIEMVEYGIAEPVSEPAGEWQFTCSAIIRFRRAARLHHDLNINLAGVSLALDLLDELETLRRKVNLLESK